MEDRAYRNVMLVGLALVACGEGGGQLSAGGERGDDAGAESSSGDVGGDAGAQRRTSDGTYGEPVLEPPPTFDMLPEGWTAIVPGGDTICAHGTPFRFFARPGKVNRLLIEFSGTGACWDEASCRPGSPYYRDTAAPDLFLLAEGAAAGIRDHQDERNPFRDWHHVYILSCGGSGHWGDNTVAFGEGDRAYTVHFNGTANSRAALDWVYSSFEAPDKVLVTGCSGGGFASANWSAHVRQHYGAEIAVYQFADSAVGVVPDTFGEVADLWNVKGAFPTFIPGSTLADFQDIPSIYATIGSHFDNMFMSLFTPHADGEQHRYYAAWGGGTVADWTAAMNEDVASIHDRSPNFHSFIAPGTYHCILPYPTFYEVEVGGVKIVDWLADAVVGDMPVGSLSCGDDCDALAQGAGP